MIRSYAHYRHLFAIGLAFLLCLPSAASTLAQSTDADASTPATPEVSDTVWFVLAPEGKSNGDYFDIHLDAGERTTVRATIGNGSTVPVTAVMYAADAERRPDQNTP